MGEPAFQPSALSAFASAHKLKTVYLSVPCAADQGPFSDWLRSAVKALHGAGVTTVAALGGDVSWASQPQLAATWTRSALTAAPFDAVQFDVEPWVNATDSQLPAIVGDLSNMYDAAAQAAGKVPIGGALPWWLATKPDPSGGTLFGQLLSHIHSVAIVTFVDHAEGEDGIVALAHPAAAVASAARIPFTIGLEADSPDVAGGSAATFGDNSAAALEGQSTIVRARLSGLNGYSGIAVEHLLSWKDLLTR
ncbi:hypothetical protein [Leifsonia xyli]|nr:hypothetical protein [Leifsonia xyli]